MAKKSFRGGLNSLLGEQTESIELKEIQQPEPKKEEVKEDLKPTFRVSKSDEIKAPKKPKKEITKTSQTGTKENETRATFIIKEELLEKLKAIAYWERAMIKDIINVALLDAVAKYEKKNGELKLMPKK